MKLMNKRIRECVIKLFYVDHNIELGPGPEPRPRPELRPEPEPRLKPVFKGPEPAAQISNTRTRF